MTDHPITPPPELVEQWFDACVLEGVTTYDEFKEFKFAAFAAQWGADQELEACLDQLQRWGIQGVDNLRNTRRPKPLSLKEQAMRVLLECGFTLDGRMELEPEDIDIIHRALEALPND
jgi:hypothetical protein